MTNNSVGSTTQNEAGFLSAAKKQISLFADSLNSNLAAAAFPEKKRRACLLLEKVIIFSLLAYAIFAPHSIALTQGAYLLGLFAWAIQMAVARDFRQRKTPVDVALLGFFACAVISSFLSYVPLDSIKGLRSPAFFLAFYFVIAKVRSLRFAGLLAILIVASCMVNVGYSAAKMVAGRGLHIDSISGDSPFSKRGLQPGDIILEAEGQKVNTQEDLYRAIESRRGLIQIKFQRVETVMPTVVAKRDVSEAAGVGVEKLGLTTSPGRRIRVSGFYSHYETYAEVLQLIAALAVGMLIAHPKKRSSGAYFLGAAILLVSVALIMTSTRAAMFGLAVAVVAMAIMSLRRRILAVAALAILLMAPAALFAIEYSRGISVFDTQEGSASYRLEVWREAFSMIKDHPLAGIGKGSEGSDELRREYKLYQDGHLPPGHFHSTPIQIATWWGLPALIFYISVMTIFAVEIWRLNKAAQACANWRAAGIALGGMGALVAFNVSSVVHFNFGDGEVVMAFWLLVGLAFAVRRIMIESRGDVEREPTQATPLEEHSDKSPRQEQEVAVEASVRAARARRNS